MAYSKPILSGTPPNSETDSDSDFDLLSEDAVTKLALMDYLCGKRDSTTQGQQHVPSTTLVQDIVDELTQEFVQQVQSLKSEFQVCVQELTSLQKDQITKLDLLSQSRNKEFKQVRGILHYFTRLVPPQTHHVTTQTEVQFNQGLSVPHSHVEPKPNSKFCGHYTPRVLLINNNFDMCLHGYNHFCRHEMLTPPLFDVKNKSQDVIPAKVECPRCQTTVCLYQCQNCSTHTMPHQPCTKCAVLPPHMLCSHCNYVLLTNLDHFKILIHPKGNVPPTKPPRLLRQSMPLRPVPLPSDSSDADTDTTLEPGDEDLTSSPEGHSSPVLNLPDVPTSEVTEPSSLSTNSSPAVVAETAEVATTTTSPSTALILPFQQQQQEQPLDLPTLHLNPERAMEYRTHANFVNDSCNEWHLYDFWADVYLMIGKTDIVQEKMPDRLEEGVGWNEEAWQIFTFLGYMFSGTQSVRVFNRTLTHLYAHKLLNTTTLFKLVMDIKYLQHCCIPKGDKGFLWLLEPTEARAPPFPITLAQLVATLVVRAIHMTLHPDLHPGMIICSQSEVSRMLPRSMFRPLLAKHLLLRALTVYRHQCHCLYHKSYILPGPFFGPSMPPKAHFDHSVHTLYPDASKAVLVRLFYATAGKYIYMGMNNLSTGFLPHKDPHLLDYHDPIPSISGLYRQDAYSLLRQDLSILYPTFTERDWYNIEKLISLLQCTAYDRFYYIFQHIDYDTNWL